MVQQFTSDRGVCRANAVFSKAVTGTSNDDANQTRRASVTEDAPDTISTDTIPRLMDHCTELIYRLKSGGWFRATSTHPEPVQIGVDDLPIRLRPRSSVNSRKGSVYVDTASESGLARGVPRAGRHSQAAKRRRKGRGSPLLALPKKRGSIRYRQAIHESNHDSDSDSDSEDESVESEGAEMELIQIRIDQVRPWYEKVFRSMRQVACKDIVKAWIRYCHPKKQTTHPYNGGKDLEEIERSMNEHGYAGHNSMPWYWPSDIGWKDKSVRVGARHREPDHIHRDERLIVMMHILYMDDKGFREGAMFNLTRLKKSTTGIHLNRGRKDNEKHWLPGHVDLLNEVYRVRELELEYERGWRDADSLVTVPKPLPRCRVRKASNLAVKAAKPTSKQIKRKPAPAKAATCNAPVAKMWIDPQLDDNYMDVSDGSEPTVLADTPSSTEEVTPDASCPEPTLCKTGTFNHGLPSFDPPLPEDQRTPSVQEELIPPSSNLGPDPPIICTQPNPAEYSVTPSEVQRPVPLRDQYNFGSSSMQSFPRRQVGPRQNDFNSTAAPRVANPMRLRGTFTHSPPPRPMAPKVEHVRQPGFASSSSGFAGFSFGGAGYSSRQTGDPWSAQTEPPIYTATGDPSASLLSPGTCSFSSGYSEATFAQLDTWNDGIQTMQSYHQSLDDPRQHFGQQAVAVPRYQDYSMDNAPPAGHPNSADQSTCPMAFYNHTSLGNINSFGQFPHGQL